MSSYDSSAYGSSAYTGRRDDRDSAYGPTSYTSFSGCSGENQDPLYDGSHASNERLSLAVPDGYSAACLSGGQGRSFHGLKPLRKNETHYQTPDLPRPQRDRRHPVPEIDIPTNDLAQYADVEPLTVGSVLSGIGSVASGLGINLIQAASNYYNGNGFRPNAPREALDAEYDENGSNPYYEPSEYANVQIPGEAAKAANRFVNRIEETRYQPFPYETKR